MTSSPSEVIAVEPLRFYFGLLLFFFFSFFLFFFFSPFFFSRLFRLFVFLVVGTLLTTFIAMVRKLQATLQPRLQELLGWSVHPPFIE